MGTRVSLFKKPTSSGVRTWVLLIAGLLVIGFETVFEGRDASWPIIFSALMMMGISVPLHLDEKARNVVRQGVNKVTAPDQAAVPPTPAEASEDAEVGGK